MENKPEQKNKPVLSQFPFEGIINEVAKFQGEKPALVILYTGPADLTFLNHYLSFNSPAMDLFMKHLTIEVLKAKDIEIKTTQHDNKASGNKNV